MRRQYNLPTLAEPPFFCLPESVGWYSDWPEHLVNRSYGALDNFSIHLITAGKGTVELDGDSITLQPGDAFLYFPLMQQRYYSSQDEPWDVRWVHFYGGPKLVEYMTEHGFRRTTLWTVKSWKELLPLFHALLEEAETHSFLHLATLSSMTYTILTEFMSRAEPFTGGKPADTSDRLARLLPAIRSRASEPFVLEEWAEKAGVSTYYFCKLFRKTMQMTPLDFVTLCRLQHAKQLLLERSDWPVKQVALEVGYTNPSYFNKRFMEQEKMTPLEYRRIRLGRD
ncbi:MULTISPECIES: helix-turn-helix transcriptional regulator [Paenibacillus]|jgi:AraC-like DNA-binding protein|uniref:AraC family transcriptional regulator n=1 Tax=Paenibacillus oceani TaxID=2772510 RepID=A0A927CEJ5_9BACL|nr:AraC family transcriptional regulator [Paenibacillus oceani]MBD2864521.1 AraC family transcriptional regulator [Paenibacillus oceani]MDF2661208.1 transcriptional regulator, AraC family [Paenibacillus sp.]